MTLRLEGADDELWAIPRGYAFYRVFTALSAASLTRCDDGGAALADPVALGVKAGDLDAVDPRRSDRVGTRVRAVGASMPLLSAVLSHWEANTPEDGDRRVLLVSSAPARGHAKGSATDGVARFVTGWLARIRPELHIEVLEPRADDDPYRNDGLPDYVRTVVRPPIERARRELARIHSDDWPDLLGRGLKGRGAQRCLASALRPARLGFRSRRRLPEGRGLARNAGLRLRAGLGG